MINHRLAYTIKHLSSQTNKKHKVNKITHNSLSSTMRMLSYVHKKYGCMGAKYKKL